VPRAAERLN